MPLTPATLTPATLRPCVHLGEAQGASHPVTSSLQPQQGAWHVVDSEGGSSLTSTEHTESIGPFENPM